MNFSLYKQMMKVNLKGMLNYAFGSAFYILLMFWLYPSIAGNTDAINDMIKAMPEGVGNAFGLQGGFSTADSFISGEYYELILVFILSIFCVAVSTHLMAKLVDQGSMAYLLSTPTTRGKIAFTQASVLVTGLFTIMAVTTAAGFIGNAWFLEGKVALNEAKFLEINLMAFLLFFAVSGISFLVSAALNDEKQAVGLSGALTFGFFTLNLLGKISDKIEWMRNISIFSLYRPGEIVSANANWGWPAILLTLIGLATFAIGIQLFRKRDLPL